MSSKSDVVIDEGFIEAQEAAPVEVDTLKDCVERILKVRSIAGRIRIVAYLNSLFVPEWVDGADTEDSALLLAEDLLGVPGDSGNDN